MRSLNRRTFIKGLGLAAGASMMPLRAWGQADFISVGAIVPLSGALASFGPRFQVAAEIERVADLLGSGDVICGEQLFERMNRVFQALDGALSVIADHEEDATAELAQCRDQLRVWLAEATKQ